MIHDSKSTKKVPNFYSIRFNYLFIYLFVLEFKRICSLHGTTSNLKSKVVNFTD